MMDPRRSFQNLSPFERGLWLFSFVLVLAAFLWGKDLFLLIGSVIGVTALIFVAKGDVLGQILTVVFSVFYGIVSLSFHYYGEMATYLFMTAPMAVMAVVSWLRHPYQKNPAQVEVHKLSRKEWTALLSLAAVTTFAFYFLLKALDTPNLLFSTISVTTSFLAAGLTYFRSAYYALAYAANDVVLVILWVSASMQDTAYLSMAVCFLVFFLNDSYGFFNWSRISRRQKAGE